MIKLTIDCRMITSSGIGAYLRQIMTGLFELHPDWQYNLIVAGVGLPVGVKLPPRVKLRRARSAIYSLAEQIEIAAIASVDSDVLWVPHYNIPLLAISPIICTIHDVAHLAVPEISRNVVRRTYATAMMQMVRRRARHIFFVSKFSEQEFTRLVGPLQQTTSTTYNSISQRWRDFSKSNSSSSLSIPPFDYVIYVGNVKPHKNLVRLLNAFKITIKRHDIKLLIVGQQEGFIVSDSLVATEAQELGDRIIFTGFVEDAVLMGLVAGAQALIFPSLYEGFGIPPLEAMAVSCPTVVSDINSVREACGPASLYIDPLNVESIAAGILAVLEDASLRDRLRKAGRMQVAQFSDRETAKIVASAVMKAVTPKQLSSGLR